MPSQQDTAVAAWWQPLFRNAAHARLWRLVAGLFLFVGCLGLIERAWTAAVDTHARRTWPSVEGEIVSSTQRDDSDLARRSGSIRGGTRYWVEYKIRFALPADRCRTGITFEDPAHLMPCEGIVRTRPTRSTAEVFDWFLHGYHLNQRVTVLWNPDGSTSADIKIAGEPLWLRYDLARLVLLIVWVLAFGALWAFSHSRLVYFAHIAENQSQVRRG